MSDIRRITESRKAQREATRIDLRATIAAEDAADALEGIRQDLTLIANRMMELLQQISTIAHNTK